jgi:hypothetical protein
MGSITQENASRFDKLLMAEDGSSGSPDRRSDLKPTNESSLASETDQQPVDEDLPKFGGKEDEQSKS